MLSPLIVLATFVTVSEVLTATAVSLIKKGYCVDVFESKKNLGGRAGSFIKDGKLLDIGQHVFLPSYKNFINLLKDLGCY